MLWILVAFLPLYVVGKVFENLAFHTNQFDTGIYCSLVRNIATGRGFMSLGLNHMGEHFSPIVALLAPIFWVWPSAYVLMIVQGLAVGLTLWPLLWLCDHLFQNHDKKVRVFWGCAVVVGFFVYQPLMAAWRFEFQPITLGMPLVAAAVVALHKRRAGWLTLWVVLLLATRESAPLSVFGLAIYAALVLKQWRASIVLMIVGLVIAAAVFLVIMPWQRAGAYTHLSRLGPLALWPGKFEYLLFLILPFAFLPLLGWRALLAAAPDVALNVAVGYPQQFSSNYHYDAQLGVFIMIAAIYGAARFTQWIVGRSRQTAIIAFIVCIALIISGGSIALGETPFKVIKRYWPTHQALAYGSDLKKLLPSPDAVVCSSGRLAPHLFMWPHYIAMEATDHGNRLPTGAWVILYVGPNSRMKRFDAWFFKSPAAHLVERSGDLAAYRWQPDLSVGR